MVDISPSENNNLVDIGSTAPVTFQVLQDVYNSLTGKTEKIGKTFSEAYTVDRDDIRQLDLKISQISDQFNVKIQNSSVTVYHINGQNEKFSSFDRFKMYNESNTCPTENVHLEYDFLIILPQIEKPQKYKISIDLPSQVGIIQRANSETDLPAQLFNLMSRSTGRMSIEFVDYTVARTFQTHIEEWFDGLDSTPKYKIVSLIQRKSHWLQIVICFIAVSALFYAVLMSFTSGSSSVSNPNELAKFITTLGGLSFAVFAVSSAFGKLVEHSIDRIQPLGSVTLNNGDKKCIKAAKKRSALTIAKLILGIIGAAATSVASDSLAKLISSIL